MSSLWGALGGLGDGLQTVGSNISKRALDEKMQKAREGRAEQLAIASEDRAEARKLRTPVGSELVQGTEGETWEQPVNAFGDPVGERRLASKQKIDAARNAERKETLTMQGLEQTVTLGGLKLGDYEASSELDLDYKRAGIDQRLASAEGSRKRGDAALIRANNPSSGRSGTTDAATATPRDYANLLKKEASAIITQYSASPTNTQGLTAAQIDDVTNQAVRIAASMGEDPTEVLKRLLEDEAGRRTGNKSLQVRMTDGI